MMEIRRAVADDVSAITEAEELIFPDPWTRKDILSAVCQSGAMCYVAISDGKLAAYVIGRVIAPEGEIYRIATLPEKRGRGIGYRILDFAVKTERGRGLESLFLEVRSQNIPALALYRAYGFKKIGVRKNYYKNPSDDAIVMVKASPADLRGI